MDLYLARIDGIIKCCFAEISINRLSTAHARLGFVIILPVFLTYLMYANFAQV